MRELVAKCVVGGAEGLLGSHKVNNQGSGGDEEDLHEGVVDADEVHEEVHVSHAEDQQIDFLCFTRETCTQSQIYIRIDTTVRDLPTTQNTLFPSCYYTRKEVVGRAGACVESVGVLTNAVSSVLNAIKQDEDSSKMEHISGQSENVHDQTLNY